MSRRKNWASPFNRTGSSCPGAPATGQGPALRPPACGPGLTDLVQRVALVLAPVRLTAQRPRLIPRPQHRPTDATVTPTGPPRPRMQTRHPAPASGQLGKGSFHAHPAWPHVVLDMPRPYPAAQTLQQAISRGMTMRLHRAPAPRAGTPPATDRPPNHSQPPHPRIRPRATGPAPNGPGRGRGTARHRGNGPQMYGRERGRPHPTPSSASHDGPGVTPPPRHSRASRDPHPAVLPRTHVGDDSLARWRGGLTEALNWEQGGRVRHAIKCSMWICVRRHACS